MFWNIWGFPVIGVGVLKHMRTSSFGRVKFGEIVTLIEVCRQKRNREVVTKLVYFLNLLLNFLYALWTQPRYNEEILFLSVRPTYASCPKPLNGFRLNLVLEMYKTLLNEFWLVSPHHNTKFNNYVVADLQFNNFNTTVRYFTRHWFGSNHLRSSQLISHHNFILSYPFVLSCRGGFQVKVS
jgi:hypothetical protein